MGRIKIKDGQQLPEEIQCPASTISMTMTESDTQGRKQSGGKRRETLFPLIKSMVFSGAIQAPDPRSHLILWPKNKKRDILAVILDQTPSGVGYVTHSLLDQK